MKNENAHKTAITRYKLSAPIKTLIAKNVLIGSVADFGCGKGFDADQLGFNKYDPHFFPEELTDKYDTIVNNFVLNVVDQTEENAVLSKIFNLLTENGTAYITVRRDVKEDGFTKSGTYQRNVILDLPIFKESKGKWCIYKLEKPVPTLKNS